jgi:hypothetical protein
MKANELMIEDWVYNKNIDKPMQVYPMMFSQMFRRTPNATTEDYNIFPIPLTPEILEKNGFTKSTPPPGIHARCYELDNKKDKYHLTIADYNKYKRLLLNVDSKDSECFNIKCDYVHKFQHALRLCGIDKTIEL